eukprot:CAMPEP_0172482598 /NCGR_PEP_ID=MMETSP1066-20121228/9084_1 /TAXON_ID=671091 /ORGANISM="Coscinodiscus wailesii, Strain CCMP2513" /LENGTH=1495 /DNA_ID=CAMNT_0013245843 /DNA_START=135 /DNA_END=4622 /DNA_ORIENTATION=+
MATSDLSLHDQTEIQNTTQRYGSESPKLASLLSKIGMSYHCCGEYSRALSFFNESLEIRIKSSGKESLSVANSRQRIGVSLIERSEEQDRNNSNAATMRPKNNENDDDHEAVNHLYESIRIRIQSRTSSSLSIDMAEAYHYLGIALTRLHDFEGAISYLQIELEMRSTILGPQDIQLSQTYFRMGVAYLHQGGSAMTTLAIESLGKALIISRTVLGRNDEILGTILYNLGNAYLVNNNDEEALECFLEAFLIQGEILGSDSVTAVNTLFTVGIIHCGREDYDKAIECFSTVARVREMNNDERGVVVVLDVLGNTFYHQKHFAKALDCYGKVYQVKKNIFENDDESDNQNLLSSVKETLMKLGRTYFQLGERENAKMCFMKVFKGNGNDGKSRRIIGLMNDVAMYHLEGGDVGTAMEVLQEAAAQQGQANAAATTTLVERADPELMMTMTHIGRMRWDNQDYELAVLAFTEAKMIAFEILKDKECVTGMDRALVDNIKRLTDCLVRDVHELRNEMTRRHEEEEDAGIDRNPNSNREELYANESDQRTNNSTTLLNNVIEEATNSTNQGSRGSTVTNIASGTQALPNHQGNNNAQEYVTLKQDDAKEKNKENNNNADSAFNEKIIRQGLLLNFIIALQDVLEVSTGTRSSYDYDKSFNETNSMTPDSSARIEIDLQVARRLMCLWQYCRLSLLQQKGENRDVFNDNDDCYDIDNGYFSLNDFIELLVPFLGGRQGTTPRQLLRELLVFDDSLSLNNEITTANMMTMIVTMALLADSKNTVLKSLKETKDDFFRVVKLETINDECTGLLETDEQQDTNGNLLKVITNLQECVENNDWHCNINAISQKLSTIIVSLLTRNDETTPSISDTSLSSVLGNVKLRDVVYNVITLSFLFLGKVVPEQSQWDGVALQAGPTIFYNPSVENTTGRAGVNGTLFYHKGETDKEEMMKIKACSINHICPWSDLSAPPVTLCLESSCHNHQQGQGQDQDPYPDYPEQVLGKNFQNNNLHWYIVSDDPMFPAKKITNHNAAITPSLSSSTVSKNDQEVTITTPSSSKKRDGMTRQCYLLFERKTNDITPSGKKSLLHHYSLFHALVLVTVLLGVLGGGYGDTNNNWFHSNKHSSSTTNGTTFRGKNECPYSARGILSLLFHLSQSETTAQGKRLCELSDSLATTLSCWNTHASIFDFRGNYHDGNGNTTHSFIDTMFPFREEILSLQENRYEDTIVMEEIFKRLDEAPFINESYPYFDTAMSHSNNQRCKNANNLDNTIVKNNEMTFATESQCDAPKQKCISSNYRQVTVTNGKSNIAVMVEPPNDNTTISAAVKDNDFDNSNIQNDGMTFAPESQCDAPRQRSSSSNKNQVTVSNDKSNITVILPVAVKVSDFGNDTIQNDEMTFAAKPQPEAPNQVTITNGKSNIAVIFASANDDTTLPAAAKKTLSPALSVIELFLLSQERLSTLPLLKNNGISDNNYGEFRNGGIVSFLLCGKPSGDLVKHASCA